MLHTCALGGSRYPAILVTPEPPSSPSNTNRSNSDDSIELDSNRIGCTVAHGDINWGFKVCGRLVSPGLDGVNPLINQCIGRYPDIHLIDNVDVNLGDSDDDTPMLTMEEARDKWPDEIIFNDQYLIKQQWNFMPSF